MSFPNESAEYRGARDRLLQQEIELRRTTEAVAQARRELPPGGEVPEDYVFDGQDGPVKLSELFAPGRDSLIVYSMMFPRDPGDDRPGADRGKTAELPLDEAPCPSCVGLIDQLEGAAEHANQLTTLVISAKAPIERVLTFAGERGWRRLTFVSSANNAYNRAYLAETEEGHQRPLLNVFRRDGGRIRHFWGSELFHAPSDPGQDPRHLGTIEPFWNLLDLTPEGRPPDHDEQISYPAGTEEQAPAEDDADLAGQIIGASRYMTIATADESGRPWISPVFFAPGRVGEFLWISRPEAQHSRNIAVRPQVTLSIFDSHQPPGTGQGVYVSGRAELVEDGEGVEAYSEGSERWGGGPFARDDVTGDAEFRLYRAIADEAWVLNSAG